MCLQIHSVVCVFDSSYTLVKVFTIVFFLVGCSFKYKSIVTELLWGKFPCKILVMIQHFKESMQCHIMKKHKILVYLYFLTSLQRSKWRCETHWKLLFYQSEQCCQPRLSDLPLGGSRIIQHLKNNKSLGVVHLATDRSMLWNWTVCIMLWPGAKSGWSLSELRFASSCPQWTLQELRNVSFHTTGKQRRWLTLRKPGQA